MPSNTMHRGYFGVSSNVYNRCLRDNNLDLVLKLKFGFYVQKPGSYWKRSSALPLVGLEPTKLTADD